jgi:hypothetical protein
MVSAGIILEIKDVKQWQVMIYLILIKNKNGIDCNWNKKNRKLINLRKIK